MPGSGVLESRADGDAKFSELVFPVLEGCRFEAFSECVDVFKKRLVVVKVISYHTIED